MNKLECQRCLKKIKRVDFSDVGATKVVDRKKRITYYCSIFCQETEFQEIINDFMMGYVKNQITF
jgi:hypothetical protein